MTSEEVKNYAINRYEELLESVSRDGIDRLMDFIRKSDFYKAPASTRFHGSHEGGLLEHSLNVYERLVDKENNPVWAEIYKDIDPDSFIIVALLHDICKTYYYSMELKNQKTYDAGKVANAERWQVKHDNNGDFIWETVPAYVVDDKIPYGHGEKSVMMIEEYIKLKPVERYAIRWHMGPYSGQQDWNTLGDAIERYPLVLALFEADMEATRIIEKEDK